MSRVADSVLPAWTHMKGNLVRFLQGYRAERLMIAGKERLMIAGKERLMIAGKDRLRLTDKEKEVYDLSAARKRRRRSRAGY